MSDLTKEWNEATPISQEAWDAAAPLPADVDPEMAAKLSEIAKIKDPQARRKASQALGLENAPFLVRKAVQAGGEIQKAINEPRKYLLEGIDPETGGPNVLQRAARGATQGLTLGFGDELAGALESAVGPKTYETARDEIRAKNKAAQAGSGGEYGAAMLVGSLLPVMATKGGAAPAIPAQAAPSILSSAARNAAVGAGYGGAIGAGQSEDNTAGETAKGAVLGGLLGGGLGTISGLARKLGMSIPAVKAWLERQAGQQALKGMGATRVDFAKLDNPARGGVPGTAAKVGRVALEEGVPLSDPQAAAAATRAMKSEAGARMGAIKAAPGAESAVDFPAFAQSVKDDVIGPLSRPETPQFAGTAQKVGEWLDNLTVGMLRKRAAAQGKALISAAEVENPKAISDALKAFQGIAGTEARPKWQVIAGDPAKELGRLSLEEAHQIRQGLDELTRAYGIPNESAPAMKEALIAARNKLAEQMTAGAEGLGLGSEWSGASEAFKTSAKLNQLAQHGAERAGNDVVGLTDVVAGAGSGITTPKGVAEMALNKLLKVKGPEWMAKGAFGAAERVPGIAKSIQAPASASARYGPTEAVTATKTGEPAGPDPVKVLTEALEQNQAGLGSYAAEIAARQKEGGPDAVARWHYLQAAKDPQYRAILKRLSGTGAIR